MERTTTGAADRLSPDTRQSHGRLLSSARQHSRPGARPRLAAWLLLAGGAVSALNGAAHFALPVMYSWQQHAEGLYEPVSWALFATTAFFALLLVLAGVLTAAMALASDLPRRFVVSVAGGMAGFWVVGAIYELVIPFPDPAARWALPVFSLFTAALYLVGGWLWRPRAG